MSPIRVVVIDESRTGAPERLASLNEDHTIRIAARSSQADELDALCDSHHPDVLLLSADAVRRADADWRARLRRHGAETRILLLTDAPQDAATVDWLSIGARGCVDRHQTPLLGKAVHAVHQGETWVSRKLARLLVDRLIERERRVMA